MQSKNNKTKTPNENNITTTQGGSEQCKIKMNTTYKNNQKNPSEEAISL
jgi:hypothetical protein